jgi:DNA-binding transcriptional MerR regulator
MQVGQSAKNDNPRNPGSLEPPDSQYCIRSSISVTASKRLYYKIGEACKLLDIQPYVLRYWETEFPLLAPSKSKSGQRVYSEAELAIIRRIKELLYDEGFTIAGAKKRLEVELAAAGERTEMAVGEARGPEEGLGRDQQLGIETEAPLLQLSARSQAKKLDTHAAKRIETFRDGIGEALRQAREILARIGPTLSH